MLINLAHAAPQLIDDVLAIAAAGLEGDHSPYFFSCYANNYGFYML